MRLLAQTLTTLAAGSVLSALTAAQQVHDVSPGTGALAAAITAASDGDILVLRPGTYGDPGTPTTPATTFLGKPLTIVASGEGTVTIRGYLLVQDIEEEERVVIRGVDFNCKPETVTSNIAIPRNLGTFNFDGLLWLEDCRFVAGDANYGSPGGQLALWGTERGTARTVMSRCQVVGGDAISSTWPKGQHGLYVQDMSLAVYSSSLTGGRGLDTIAGDGGDGGDGIYIEDAYMHASGCSFDGGDGGDHTGTQITASGGDGGDSIRSVGSLLDLADLQNAPGSGGSGPAGAGADGVEFDLFGSTKNDLTSTWSQLIMETPINDGDSYTVTHLGPPNSVAFYIFAADPSFLMSGGYVYHGTTQSQYQFLDSTGFAQVTATLNDFVKPPDTGAHLFVQAMNYVDQGGSAAFNGLSSPSVLIVVESSAAPL